ncbi:hypothetical protein WMF45_13575 [Sorangium sp. So ce448]|uniref:hypothetical protein n=1 Tax=Sorangium sp. So ce448 TaxID=3133314 RepID=UPI003F63889E
MVDPRDSICRPGVAGARRLDGQNNGEWPLAGDEAGLDILLKAFKCLAIKASVEVHT